MSIRKYRGNIKGLVFIVCFRIAHFFTQNKVLYILGGPIWILYRVVFNWFLGIDIPERTKIGKGFVVWHGTGLIIHHDTIIGNNVSMRQNTTIGNAYSGGPVPIIEDDVTVGPNSVILGGITVGKGATIGAGAVVVKNVLPGTVVVGNPAHEIYK